MTSVVTTIYDSRFFGLVWFGLHLKLGHAQVHRFFGICSSS